MDGVTAGNTAWVLASAALVLFMTPGLAFFYGGMVRAKNVLGMLMQNFFSMGLVSVLWAVVVFSLAFLALWLVLVYAPVAYWVFSPTGWLFKRGALDFAGGTVVHINAGIAALAVVMVLGKRRGWPQEAMHPHSLPWTLLGTGVLW